MLVNNIFVITSLVLGEHLIKDDSNGFACLFLQSLINVVDVLILQLVQGVFQILLDAGKGLLSFHHQLDQLQALYLGINLRSL